MTYRNKLLLKRTLIVLGIILVVLFILGCIVFAYLGRYVVYTEDGAYFSFLAESTDDTSENGQKITLSSIDLVTGEPISADDVLGVDDHMPEADQVEGVLVDYETLVDGTTLNSIDLTAEANNTLVLEMRKDGSDLLDTESVEHLIARAEAQGTWLVAMISCLSDSNYAAAHEDQAIEVYGGTLWTDDNGNDWLDPAQSDVIDYLAQMVVQLADMGFDEVILADFYLPTDDRIDYDTGDQSRSEIVTAAYEDLLDATIDACKLSLLITDPTQGHQAFDAADRIYVYYQDGGTAKAYIDQHPDQYVVFITDSHDTRFEEFGKIETDRELDVDPIEVETQEESEEEEPET
jgi:hypothetical protein